MLYLYVSLEGNNSGRGTSRCDRSQRLTMQTIEFRVQPAMRQQLLMRTRFNDPSFFHNDNPVGDAQRRKTVRHQNRCPSTRQIVKTTKNFVFRLNAQT